MSHTVMAVGALSLFALFLLWQVYRSLRNGRVSLDLNFFAENARPSDFAIERADLPSLYWALILASTALILALGVVAVLMARAGVS